MPARHQQRFVVCVDRGEYPVALDCWKIYQVLNDPDGERHGLIRIVDDTGEDYLFPARLLHPIELSTALQALFSTTGATGTRS